MRQQQVHCSTDHVEGEGGQGGRAEDRIVEKRTERRECKIHASQWNVASLRMYLDPILSLSITHPPISMSQSQRGVQHPIMLLRGPRNVAVRLRCSLRLKTLNRVPRFCLQRQLHPSPSPSPPPPSLLFSLCSATYLTPPLDCGDQVQDPLVESQLTPIYFS